MEMEMSLKGLRHNDAPQSRAKIITFAPVKLEDEEDIEWILSVRENHTIFFFDDFSTQSIKTWKFFSSFNHLHPCHPWQQTTGNSFSAVI